MAPGNAWHFPSNAEFPLNDGMRSPFFPTDPNKKITIFNGNQSGGGGNAANQLQDGSEVVYKRASEKDWKRIPMVFHKEIGNNKYFRGEIPGKSFSSDEKVQYYLAIAYADRDKTYLKVPNNDPTGLLSEAVTVEATAQASPFTFTMDTKKNRGEWSDTFLLPNVAAHAHLLRTGEVLMWGRRDNPQQSMNVDPPNPPDPNTGDRAPPATCTPFLLNPDTQKTRITNQPLQKNGQNANLFCSGHTFQPDGSLLVAGGHITDESGLKQSSIYVPPDSPTSIGTWKTGPEMQNGRWYPTVVALPTSTALVADGTYRVQGSDTVIHNTDTQVFAGDKFLSSQMAPQFDLYPRIHVASTGRIFALSLQQKIFEFSLLESAWKEVPKAVGRPLTDYGCSVMFEQDKVIFVGGGNPPDNRVDWIDLSKPEEKGWQALKSMNFKRRQHNATVLPDGSIFVTGGSRGPGFNDLSPGAPIHIAELWNPDTKEWTMMAAEQTDRCYHSTAVLLPDGRVLSAGGGEFQLGAFANPKQDSHLEAQIFSPPYMFQSGRPTIDSISSTKIQYGATFEVGTADPKRIAKVSLIGLSSVTHSNNTGQRLSFLNKQPKGGVLQITAPPKPESSPPGFYMLFIVDDRGVPSVAKMVQIITTSEQLNNHKSIVAKIAAEKHSPQTVIQRRQAVRQTFTGTRVEIGITTICPYGLSACWGGAHEALRHLPGVEGVDPIPHTSGSTASVFLADNSLPDLSLWTKQFKDSVRQTYVLRGFEAAVTGTVEKKENGLVLILNGMSENVDLVGIEADGKIQLDKETGRPQALTEDERTAYETLKSQLSTADGIEGVAITGPVSQTETGYKIQVRLVKS